MEVLLSERTKRNAMERVRQLTPRNWGGTLVACISQDQRVAAGLARVLRDRLSVGEHALRKIDAHLRRRLRAIQLRHWKRKRTIARKLIRLGVKRDSVWRQLYSGRKSWWALSHTHAVDHGLRNAYFAKTWAGPWSTFTARRPPADRRPRAATTGAMGMIRGRKPAGGGGHNPPSRRAVYDQRTYGSVGAGAGNRPGYPSAPAEI